MSEEGKAVIIPTSSGAAKGPDWLLDAEKARAKRKESWRPTKAPEILSGDAAGG